MRITFTSKLTLLKRGIIVAICFIIISACSRSKGHEAQGYVEGRYTYMATSVSGVLMELMVARGAKVQKGKLLFVLEGQPESDEYDAALENFNQTLSERDAIIANLSYAKITYERNKILVPKQAIQQSALDSAKANYQALLAQLAQANANIASSKATLAQSLWRKNQKSIISPIDGVVFDTYYRLGEYTEANQAILSLLAPKDIKVVFYINEMNLGSIKLNNQITVMCDGCEKKFVGRISFISPTAEYTPPVIYSNDTNEKLVYRIEAEFSVEDAIHLHPGQPVRVIYE